MARWRKGQRREQRPGSGARHRAEPASVFYGFPVSVSTFARFVSSASPNFAGDSHPRGRGPDGPRLTPTLAGPTARGNQGPAARRNRVAAGRAAAAPSVTMTMTERAGVAAKRNSSGRVAGGGYTAAPA